MSNEPDYTADRAAAVEWARKLLARSDVVILDTETTGLGASAEVVQIAIISVTGQVLLDTLVKPTQPIPPDATRIHHITDAMVEGAPTFDQIAPQLRELLSGQTCVIYNADYDSRVLHQSAAARQLPYYEVPIFGAFGYTCAMEQYSAYVGDWSDYHGNYRYQKLPGGDHTALGDARATLRLIQRMAGVPNASITIPVMDYELRGYEEHYARHYKEGSWRELRETPLCDALSAFVADLVAAYSDRAGSRERQSLAHKWLTQWRRDLGWRPIFERQNDAPPDDQP